MSRIEDLITEHCPAGVPRKKLGEVGEFVRGGGLQKKDFVDEGFPCIHYGQIYTFYGTSATTTKSFISPALAATLKKAEPGDLVVTTTSENIEDVCTAVAWLGERPIAIGGHSCVYKHTLDPMYVAYYFQTEQFEIQKRKFVTGTKVKDIKTSDIARVEIPVPPLAIQREIASILDKMESLKAELEAELDLRGRQYAFYRDQLLTFLEAGGVRWVPMGELGTIFGGLTGKSKADFSNGNARYVSYVNAFNNLAVNVEADDYVRVGAGERQRSLQLGDVVFTGSSESAADVAMSSVVTTAPEGPLYLNSFCIGFRPSAAEALHVDFSKHLFRSGPMRAALVRTASGVTRFNVSKARLAKVEVPIPPIGEQRRIASILDKLDTLVSDLSIGLPAEIEARRKQYEYYRDRLLTFEEAA